MLKDISYTYIDAASEIFLDPGVDWPTILGFLITVFIFCLGTWLTIRNSNKNLVEQRRIFEDSSRLQLSHLELSLESQKGIAKANALKESRQSWINELRYCCAAYIAKSLALCQHASQMESIVKVVTVPGLEGSIGVATAWGDKLADLRFEVYEFKYKIELLSNPNEESFKELLDLVEKIAIGGERMELEVIVAVCNRLRDVTRLVLKSEWERVKLMV